MTTKTANTSGLIDELFQAGAHFGFVKSRRHPSTKKFIFGAKNNLEVFDLEKTSGELLKAIQVVEDKGKEGSQILFVGGKSEAREAVTSAGRELNQPFVAGRWIGGTLTNWNEIKRRIQKLDELTTQKEKGELAKYTKKERLLIDREIAKLTLYFSGLSTMKGLPKLVIIVDPKKEHIAVSEATAMKVPTIAIAGTDTNLYSVTHAIPANDSSKQSIGLIIKKLVEAYKRGQSEAKSQ